MIANKSACIAFTLAEEGGFVNDPRDPGGATKYGVTLTTLRTWLGRAVSVAFLRGMPTSIATAIYAARYWHPIDADNLPPGVDLMVFDFGVNVGPTTSARLLQGALGVEQDGDIGPETLAFAAARSPVVLAASLANMQEAHYRALPDFPTFGRGWLARTARRAALANKLATQKGI